MPTVDELRNQYPIFSYEQFSWTLDGNKLKISFHFSIEPEISFSPTLTIDNVSQEMIDNLGKTRMDSYIFNLGLAELFSYWKVAASPLIEIHAGTLDKEQIQWWHKLLIKGMGEYFFVNKINFAADDFVRISNSGGKFAESNIEQGLRSSTEYMDRVENILIPIGGGKDSAVTLEILSNLDLQPKKPVGAFVVNPTQAALDIIRAKNVNNVVKVERVIDPALLKLNNQGYLNGHVPISALLAFLSVFCADLFNYSHVAISNERSSNEGNTWYCDKEINHQYSKTFEFEKDFQKYAENYLPNGAPEYFSFLRPIYELQIAKIFSGKADKSSPNGMKNYHQFFRSCNKGQKTNSWCGECSKCLFAFVILYPFIINDDLKSYFGKNLFEDENLWPIAKELLGFGENKPLECVGTHEETIVAFYLSIKKHQDNSLELPILLEKVNLEIISKESDLEERSQALLSSWNKFHSIPEELIKPLKEYVQH